MTFGDEVSLGRVRGSGATTPSASQLAKRLFIRRTVAVTGDSKRVGGWDECRGVAESLGGDRGKCGNR